MLDFPLHPTLFFSLSIMLGLVLSYFFTLADLIDKKDKKFIMVNLFLYGSWTVAALFTLYIVHLIETDTQHAVAFAPLGMMIAALIASASVMKNITETKTHDLAKSAKEKKRKRDFALNTMQTINSVLSSLEADILGNKLGTLNDDFLPYVKTIKKLTDLVFTESTIQYLNDEERQVISMFHCQFYIFYSRYDQELKENKEFSAITSIRRLIELTIDFKSRIEKYIEVSKDQQ